jgi:hypothetical protein
MAMCSEDERNIGHSSRRYGSWSMEREEMRREGVVDRKPAERPSITHRFA